ncbi:MAG: MmgE/PrpD family protein [Acidimicrobiia bacterium]|nr:MmgE/PrpD family protein [Acidimicrobiia bacterium]
MVVTSGGDAVGERLEDGAGGLTDRVVERVRGRSFDDLPADVVLVAKQCALDWLAVSLAGSREPVARIVRDEVLDQGGSAQATLVGSGDRVAAGQAALVNGTAGHALDYDDVVSTFLGHPSAPVLPAVLALAERRGASGRSALAAFVAGFDAESLLGRTIVPGHYERGWHTTATLGTFGAAAACAHLLGLDAAQWRHAFGLAATQAGGLKASFGTMGKPLHAGKAAANGLLAATLAGRGMTAAPDAFEAHLGFAAATSPVLAPERIDGVGPGEFEVRQVLFKYHAACYLVHSTVEGVLALRREGLRPEDVETLTIRATPMHRDTCGIAEPSTPLEAKFSLRYAAAVALVTGSAGEAAFDEAVVADPAVRAVLDRVEVVTDAGLDQLMATPVSVRRRSAGPTEACVDVGRPAPAAQLAGQGERLVAKFGGLAGPVIGTEAAERVVGLVERLEELSSVAPLLRACAPVSAR